MPNFIDLTGKRFFRLVVIKRVKERTKHGEIRWLCKCDCGNERVYTASTLKNPKNVTKSCGCYRVDKMTHGFDDVSFNRLCQYIKEGAIKRGLEFALPKEYVRELTKNNCFYCGKAPSQIFRRSKKYNKEYIYNGIDRLDNSVGYVEGNVVSCCGRCNRAKFKDSPDDFKSLIVRIYNHWASH